jgi:Mlc titration factor MtfA (ptsG expression regulator)
MQWLKQLFSRERPRIPAPLWQSCLSRLPFLARLSGQDLDRLKSLAETLLDKKSFMGAGGLELSDDIAVLIAAQASLPVLHLTLDLYDDMAGVIVYPSSFIIPQTEIDDSGVVHEWHEPVSGEALDAGGAVVLSWEDAEEFDVPGYNVVIHEFAHKIDMKQGGANGRPPFLAAFHQGLNAAHWQQAFSTAYADFCTQVEALESRLPEDFDADRDTELADALFGALPLDPYAAQHPAEFFAVASEAFFVDPEPLAAVYPDVYRQLVLYYRQETLALASIATEKTR